MVRSRVDYATDQITVYRYCRFGCRYCYVWNNPLFASRVQRGKYDPVEEAKKYLKNSGRRIVVSFVSDPYPNEEWFNQLTRRVLKVLAQTRNTVMILTKNTPLALRDLDIMRGATATFYFGTTITTIDPLEAKYLEPGAPDPQQRIISLKVAKMVSPRIKTWISLEPIIPDVTDLQEIIMYTSDYVDYYVLGAFNYSEKLADKIGRKYTREQLKRYYRERIPGIIKTLEELEKQYHIKKELKRYLDV